MKIKEIANILITLTISLPPVIYFFNYCSCSQSAKVNLVNGKKKKDDDKNGKKKKDDDDKKGKKKKDDDDKNGKKKKKDDDDGDSDTSEISSVPEELQSLF